MKMRIAAILTLLLAFLSVNGLADMPPDPGYTRVGLSIHLEAADDFPAYRFFVVSGNMAREIMIKKGEKVVVDSLGGGARYRAGKVVAIPVASLSSFGTDTTGPKFKEMESAIVEGGVLGVIQLIEHSFRQDVRNSEAKSYTAPVYRLKKTEDGKVTAELVSGGKSDKNADSNTGSFYSTDPKTPAFWATVTGGSLATLAFIFIGVWAVRRSKTKSADLGSQQ